ncbi:MAG: SDR family NAD(P)-dependent oxidoreductase, partial [Candidatus Puniceispirillum sp.]
MALLLDGQTILVTGAARGLGAAFCRAIAAAGGNVLALGRDAVSLDALLTALPGGGHSKIVGDVCDASAMAAGLDGKILHAVINNAGIAVTATLAGGDMAEAQRVIDTNLMGALY